MCLEISGGMLKKCPLVEYHMPGATERKFMPAPVAQLPVQT
jgi:hypothetical protein